MHRTRTVLAHQIFQGGGAAGERRNGIVHTRAADVAFDQGGMAFIVFDHHDGDGQAEGIGTHVAPVSMIKTRGSNTRNSEPAPSLESTVMSPPRRRTNARTCANPMPSPGRSCLPARRNNSNTRSTSFSAMPRPLSRMVMMTDLLAFSYPI